MRNQSVTDAAVDELASVVSTAEPAWRRKRTTPSTATSAVAPPWTERANPRGRGPLLRTEGTGIGHRRPQRGGAWEYSDAVTSVIVDVSKLGRLAAHTFGNFFQRKRTQSCEQSIKLGHTGRILLGVAL